MSAFFEKKVISNILFIFRISTTYRFITISGLLPIEQLAKEYLKLCIDFDNSVANSKYAVGKMYKYNDQKIQKMKFGREFTDAENLDQVW